MMEEANEEDIEQGGRDGVGMLMGDEEAAGL